MNITYIEKLHNRVIHEEKENSSLKSIYAEGRQIKRLSNNQLISICESCFSIGE